jgi:hypothetical protein
MGRISCAHRLRICVDSRAGLEGQKSWNTSYKLNKNAVQHIFYYKTKIYCFYNQIFMVDFIVHL